MGRDEDDARTFAFLAAHGLTLCEDFMLCEAGYRSSAPPEVFARFARGSSVGDPRGTFSAEEHQAALASCIGRGLLKEHRPDDFDADGRRRDLQDTDLAPRRVSRATRPATWTSPRRAAGSTRRSWPPSMAKNPWGPAGAVPRADPAEW